MPIEDRKLMRAGFIVVSEDNRLGAVLLRAERERAGYVVVKFYDGRYAVVQTADLQAVLDHLGAEAQEAPLGRLTEVIAVTPPHQGSDLAEAERQAAAYPGKALAVLQAPPSQEVAGLLFSRTLRSGLHQEANTAVVELLLTPPATASEELTADPGAGIAFGLEPDLAQPPAPAETPAERFIHADLEGHDKRQPLTLGQTYHLAFWMDAQQEIEEALIPKGVRLKPNVFRDGETSVELTIRLESSDFEVSPAVQKLALQRNNPVSGRARFDISPRHNGVGVLNALFFKGPTFVQVIHIRLFTGPLFEFQNLGWDLNSALAREQTRDLNLVITGQEGAFQAILSGATAATASLPITRPYLNHMLNELRKVLLEVTNLEVEGEAYYQTHIDIPVGLGETALGKLAKAGWSLFDQLFYGPAMEAQANRMGDSLRQAAQASPLHIQICSQDFLLPWGALYVGEDPTCPDPELFLGLKHIVEHIPLQQGMQVSDPQMKARESLQVSLNLNPDIDTEMGAPLVQEQEDFWAQVAADRPAVRIVRRTTGDEVLNALKTEATSDQVLYFYCHALSKGLEDKGGPEASVLMFANGQKLTLADLEFNKRKALPGAPLVFLNACESAELSPLFYNGFVPYFMTKGARGVIGTECKVPALFAKEWALRFFDRFLQGQPLGQIALELRREFFYNHHNILGLLYALYVDGDTRLVS